MYAVPMPDPRYADEHGKTLYTGERAVTDVTFNCRQGGPQSRTIEPELGAL
jgi:hypothetical protein